MFSRIALAAAALAVLAPASAFAGSGDKGRLQAEVRIPHQCSISGGHTLDLTGRINSPAQNNVRGVTAGALHLSQNGSSIWTLDRLSVDQKPVGSELNWATGIGVDFQNRAQAPMNLDERNPQRLTANVRNTGTRRIRVDGAFSGPAAVLANIDEDSHAYNPHTGMSQASPLLGGGKYQISTVLRCTATGGRR